LVNGAIFGFENLDHRHPRDLRPAPPPNLLVPRPQPAAGHSGPLEIEPNFLAEQADVDALVAGVELGLDIASRPAFRGLIKSWIASPKRMSRADTVAFLRRYCSSYMHPVGTCAMGSCKGKSLRTSSVVISYVTCVENYSVRSFSWPEPDDLLDTWRVP
jgi:choline dehydrogenase-like flavoprotein